MKLLKKIYQDEKGKLWLFTIFLSVASVAQVAFWPFVNKLIPMVKEALPDALRWLVGGMMSEGFTFYVITSQFIKNVGMFGTILAVILAASAIARENEAGTLEFLLAQPVSRTRVITEKFFANLAILSIPIIISSLLVYPSGMFFNGEIDLWNLLLASVYGFLIMGVIYAITFFISLFVEDQMQAISAGITVSVVMTILSLFRETAAASVIGWLNVQNMLPLITTGALPVAKIAFMVSAILLFYLLSRWKFNYLDI